MIREKLARTGSDATYEKYRLNLADEEIARRVKAGVGHVIRMNVMSVFSSFWTPGLMHFYRMVQFQPAPHQTTSSLGPSKMPTRHYRGVAEVGSIPIIPPCIGGVRP